MEPIVTREGNLSVVAMNGDIDLELSNSVRHALLDALGHSQSVIVDLSRVPMVDSSGVASLLEAFQTARKKGKKLMLAGPSEGVRRVLKLARLDSVFEIASDVATAKDALT